VISYRHHIVSLVAVFLALAVGVVLGGGPLSDLGRDDRAASAAVAEKRTERAADYGDLFATTSASTLYAGRLKSHPVAIVTMPGADGDVVTALTDQVAAAGGQVAGTYAVRSGLTDPSQKSLVDTLGSQLVTQLGGSAVDTDASTYVRLGQLLGLAVAPGDLDAGDVQAIRESLAGADLVGSPKGAKAAGLVLVVLGDRTDPAILGGVAAGLAAKAPLVVAGETGTAAPDGDLGGLRSDAAAERVTTVDGVESPLGQVSATLALIRSLTTQGGAFGAAGSDGAVPIS
jgi:hypothetical protein